MRTFDYSTFYRATVGFDRVFDLLDSVATQPAPSGYPPYNIEKTGEETYQLTMAVAGFSPEDVEITVQDNTLVIAGRQPESATKAEVLYRGIAGRAFERRFVLADHIVVDGADLKNGLLHVGLKRVVPEALKPRRIAVGSGTHAIANDTHAIEAKAA